MNRRQKKKYNRKIVGKIKNQIESLSSNILFRFDDHWSDREQYMKNCIEPILDEHGLMPVGALFNGDVLRMTLVPKSQIIEINIKGGS